MAYQPSMDGYEMTRYPTAAVPYPTKGPQGPPGAAPLPSILTVGASSGTQYQGPAPGQSFPPQANLPHTSTNTRSDAHMTSYEDSKWWCTFWISVVCCLFCPVFSGLSLFALATGQSKPAASKARHTSMARGFLWAGGCLAVLLSLIMFMVFALPALS